MDRKTLNVLLATILTTLDETRGGWSPRTVIMLGCKLDLTSYTLVEGLMVKGGLVETTSETVTITAKGRDMAQKVREFAAQG